MFIFLDLILFFWCCIGTLAICFVLFLQLYWFCCYTYSNAVPYLGCGKVALCFVLFLQLYWFYCYAVPILGSGLVARYFVLFLQLYWFYCYTYSNDVFILGFGLVARCFVLFLHLYWFYCWAYTNTVLFYIVVRWFVVYLVFGSEMIQFITFFWNCISSVCFLTTVILRSMRYK